MSFFKRLFKVGESNAHAIVDKMEDPIKMTEQGIRDLKKDLTAAMQGLAEVKGIAIRTRKEADKKKHLASDYERKAMLLLKKMQSNEMPADEAERLATEALNRKEENATDAQRLDKEATAHETRANDLQSKVNKLKSTITSYENDLITLKARARTASSTKKINAQLANIDSSSTIGMLEKMKARVEEDESLAQAYGEVANSGGSIDSEIDAALGGAESADASESLLELKKRMGIS
ncbi:phage shock protein A (PspA) family protein [Desulfocicer vacuolatum DSM 3385]|uniref:Phage shock protein A (PspA) family protein n=1 Tax=Desulfocicer vacuolatum DSM 3385 TaxID=1121400 RepID=A0A1W2BEY4_9BACT|nr:PspA/IM30 family protein [Desulfocicer vacuolatum]SMC71557.1 phage shock protein A (PspA) family protein [Desulfocicer vacuolatum DSM 3385]